MTSTPVQTRPAPTTRRPGRWIDDWDPENQETWDGGGQRVAARNLVFSVLAEHLGFSVWLLWSATVVFLPKVGYDFSVNQLFWLVAIPSLVGATLRIPYTLAVSRFGGRNWTIVSAALLLIPLGLFVACVSAPGTPYWVFAVAAATAGVGGGNFASSMANISYFYPDRHKGLALGINAAGGNIGVSSVQTLVPFVVGLSGLGAVTAGVALVNAAVVWVPLVVASAVLAWLFMDNISDARSPARDQLAVARERDTWLMSILYIGTFGSFIGFSGALPLLISTQFPESNPASYAFLGALVGSLFRPLGGLLADRWDSARVSLAVFALMIPAVGAVAWAVRSGSLGAFLGVFLVLFVLTGVGNGSTYRMIPSIFGRSSRADRVGAARQTAAALGIVSAIGAYGGFLVPRAIGMSVSRTGGIEVALVGFACFYAVCGAITYVAYARRGNRLVHRAPAHVAEF